MRNKPEVKPIVKPDTRKESNVTMIERETNNWYRRPTGQSSGGSTSRSHVIAHKIMEFKRSALLTFLHLTKCNLGPTILSMPSAFARGGILFSSVFVIIFFSFIAHTTSMLIRTADYLTKREDEKVNTYDQVAYFAFLNCSKYTKPHANKVKCLINWLIICTSVDAFAIYMVFVSRTLKSIIPTHFDIKLYQLILATIPASCILVTLDGPKFKKYLPLFSIFLLWLSLFLCLKYFLSDLTDFKTDRLIGDFKGIVEFFAVCLFSLSGFSNTLTFRSEMSHPEDLPGIFVTTWVIIGVTYGSYGLLGVLKYDETYGGIFIHLPETLYAFIVQSLAISAVFLSIFNPHMTAYNNLMKNYVSPHSKCSSTRTCQLLAKYLLVIAGGILALLIPDFGWKQVLKGAIFHSHLEIFFPAVIEFVALWPEYGTGKYYRRLIKVLIFSFIAWFIFIVAGIYGFIMVMETASCIYSELFQ